MTATFYADFRAMCAQLDAQRTKREREPVREALPAVTAKAYGMRATCSLCDAPSDSQVCPHCAAYLERTKCRL